jgi:hypothetical protein
MVSERAHAGRLGQTDRGHGAAGMFSNAAIFTVVDMQAPGLQA